MKKIKKVFDKDIACDIRDDINEEALNGLSGYMITKKILTRYSNEFDDIDDGPYAWSALTFIMLENGILPNETRVRAQLYFDNFFGNEKNIILHNRIIDEIRLIAQMIKVPNDKPKKPRQKRYFQDDWEINDVYALKLESGYAIEKGIQNYYLIFIKIGEKKEYPGHVIPVCRVKITDGPDLPRNLEEINSQEYILISVDFYHKGSMRGGLQKFDGLGEYYEYPTYSVGLIATSQKSIPKELIYIGNYAGVTPPTTEYVLDNLDNSFSCHWKFAEKILINSYFDLSRRQGSRYRTGNYLESQKYKVELLKKRAVKKQ
ncbi:MAG: hypothetical protein JEZ05_09315 [Tenericutes bacterium]|nr:hypothetical protein [Mycoplasmatota bacterium]